MTWDFSPVDRLPVQPAGQGRLFRALDRGGTTLLFIHGAFHGAWCWSQYITFFSDKRVATAAMDLRGHGGLPQDSVLKAQGVADMAQDAIAAAKSLDGGIVLVGHSFGALVAMAAAHEIAAKALVLLAPAPPGGLAHDLGFPPFSPDALVAPPPEPRARKWFLQGCSDDIAPYLDRLCAESPALLNAAGTPPIGSPSIPTLCLGGSLDQSVFHQAGQDETIAKLLGADFDIIRGSGHGLMLDTQWPDSAATILGWLRRLGAIEGP